MSKYVESVLKCQEYDSAQDCAINIMALMDTIGRAMIHFAQFTGTADLKTKGKKKSFGQYAQTGIKVCRNKRLPTESSFDCFCFCFRTLTKTT